MTPTFDDILAARDRIEGRVHRTPVVTCAALDAMAGAQLFLKCENLQKVGAFKARGAMNAVLCLDDEAAARGVVAHSSGNHAQALAYAARQRGIPAYLVMPADAPAVKKAAVEGYGAEVVVSAPGQAAREACCDEVRARTGATFLHGYDDPRVVAGAATASLELLDEVPDLDAVVAPVGGGGLASGTALVCAARGVQAFGAEPAAADDAARSLEAGERRPHDGKPDTIADGLKTNLTERTFSILSAHLRGIARVEEDEIVAAMRALFERAKLVVEPSGAVSLAAALKGLPGAPARVGVILSGGNVDLARLPFA